MAEDGQLEQVNTKRDVDDLSLEKAIERLEEHLANPAQYPGLTREQTFQLGTTLASFVAVVAIYLLTSENPVATVFPAIFSTLQIRRSFEVFGQLFANRLSYLKDADEFESERHSLLIDIFHAANPNAYDPLPTVPREFEGKAGMLVYLIAANHANAGLTFLTTPCDSRIPEYVDVNILLMDISNYSELITQVKLGDKWVPLMSYDLPTITPEEYESLRLHLLLLKEKTDPDEDWFVIYDEECYRYQLLCGLNVYTDDVKFNGLNQELLNLLQTDALGVAPSLQNTRIHLTHYPIKFSSRLADVLRTED